MRMSTKLLAATAAGALPFVLGQSPAAAQSARDTDQVTTSFPTPAGATVTCELNAFHSVEDFGGGTHEFHVDYYSFNASGPQDACNAEITITATATDKGEQLIHTRVFDAHNQQFSMTLAEHRPVNVRYVIEFVDCDRRVNPCQAGLFTSTK